jgi:hypothetical protein
MSDNLQGWLDQVQEKTLLVNTLTDKVNNGTATMQDKMQLDEVSHIHNMYLNITKDSYEHHKNRKLNKNEQIIFLEAELSILKAKKADHEVKVIDQILRIESISKQQTISEKDKIEIQSIVDNMSIIIEGSQLVDLSSLSKDKLIEANNRISIMNSVLSFSNNMINDNISDVGELFRKAEDCLNF